MESPYTWTTNVHAIDGFGEVFYRIYAVDDNQSSQPSSTQWRKPLPSPTTTNKYWVLRRTISILRSSGCLVCADYEKLSLLVFSPVPDFEVLNSFTLTSPETSPESLTIENTSFLLERFGKFLSRELHDSLLKAKPTTEFDHASIRTSDSASLESKSQIINAQADVNNRIAPLQPDSAESTGVTGDLLSSGEDESHRLYIFRKLVDSIISIVMYRLTRRCGLIPLNVRSLVSSKSLWDESDDHEGNESVANIASESSIISLHIDLTASGIFLISYSFSPESRLMSIRTGMRLKFKSSAPLSGFSVWLSPGGYVARYVGPEEAMASASVSKQISPTKSQGFDSQAVDETRKRFWKAQVIDWLEVHGIDVHHLELEPWIEVEIAKIDHDSSSVQNISWPASLCFYRDGVSGDENQTKLSTWFPSQDEEGDFLGFAEEWLASAGTRQDAINQRVAEKAGQSRNDRPKTGDGLHAESSEIFARTPNYLDVHAANTVYPTPPDGIQAQRPHGASFTDGTVGTPAEPEEGSSVRNTNTLDSMNEDQSMGIINDSNLLMSGNDTIANDLATGMYDATDDEDLFGDIDGDRFDAKGLTEADFSFFDEPSLDNLEDEDLDMGDNDLQPTHELMETNDEAHRQSVRRVSADARTSEEYSRSVEPLTVAGEMAGDDGQDTTVSKLKRSSGPDSERPRAEHSPVPSKPLVSPPLSPLEVKKKMFAQNMPPPWTPNRKLTSSKRKQSLFDAVDFGELVDVSDKKYAQDGRFSVANDEESVPNANKNISSTGKIPMIGPPKRKKSLKDSFKGTGQPQHPVMDSNHTGVDRFDFGEVLQAVSSDGTESDSSSLSQESEQPLPSLLSAKRKRRLSDEAKGSPFSNDTQPSPGQIQFLRSADDLDTFSRLSPNIADWPFDGYFSTSESVSIRDRSFGQDEHAQLAQILVDQITQSSFGNLGATSSACSVNLRVIHKEYDDAIRSVFKTSTMEDLHSLVKLEGESHTKVKLEDSKGDIQAAEHDGDLKSDIFKLPPQHVRIRRTKHRMEMLPSVLPFWETFSLGPHSGPKDVVAYCIYPPCSNAREGATSFLNRLGEVYQSCSLGTHNRGDSSEEAPEGLVQWTWDTMFERHIDMVLMGLRKVCLNLGILLAKKSSTNRSFVIYIIDPFGQVNSMVGICEAFLVLFRSYLQSIGGEQAVPNELVLQVVPIEFIASSDSLVVPSQADYINLALEVYDRCPPNPSIGERSGSIMQFAPAVVLAKPLPQTIDFQQTAEKSSALMQEGSCLHLAYSQSLDERWVTAAWSDATGSFQTTLSYCLRREGSSSSRSLTEVLSDIWGATCEILQTEKIQWQVVVVKAGAMSLEEIESWKFLSSKFSSSSLPAFNLALFTVATNSTLSILPQPCVVPTNLLSAAPGAAFTTPVSTPQPTLNTASPDTNLPATPSGSQPINTPTPTLAGENSTAYELDPEAVLADASDETWGVILSHQLNNSRSLVEIWPALGSGYLVKRKGAVEADGWATMAVNVIWLSDDSTDAGGERKRAGDLLREVLGMYRGLGILARAKGMVGKKRPGINRVDENDAVWPWHVATVVKGVRALTSLR